MLHYSYPGIGLSNWIQIQFQSKHLVFPRGQLFTPKLTLYCTSSKRKLGVAFLELFSFWNQVKVTVILSFFPLVYCLIYKGFLHEDYIPLTDGGGRVLRMSDHGFCWVLLVFTTSWARFFSSRILLHISCNAPVIARPEMLPWQRNMWHLCLLVFGSRATKAKSLKRNTKHKYIIRWDLL